MTIHERLRALAEVLPPNGSVSIPRSEIEAWLEADAKTESDTANARADYTVAEIAERFGKAPQTVRDWIKAGKLQAYPFGKEYRITPAALAEFEERLRIGESTRHSSTANYDLRAWREAIKAHA